MIDNLIIVWNPDIVAFSIGSFGIRWYSLCWCIGLVAVYLLAQHLYKEQGIPDKKFEPLFIYSFVGILIGSRLGHCLFYEPEYFLQHPLEIVIPAKQLSDGTWHFTGYTGLASHGGAFVFILSLCLYSKKYQLPVLTTLDNIGIVTPICSCAIRLGNLMNSEIIGKPTDVPWAFIFKQVDDLSRHPGQLYEAIAYFCFFWIGYFLYKKMPQKVGSGFYLGFCLFSIFTFRFFIEYIKEVQEKFEENMLLNMGQLLSIPFILIGGFFMIRPFILNKK